MANAIYFGRKSGVYPMFSNFTDSPIEYQGICYDSVEQAFQASKTLDMNVRREFVGLSGAQAKAKGRSVSLRSDWEEVKLNVMLECQRAKFYQNAWLREILVSTGDRLLLENTIGWKDNLWGCDFSTKPIGRNWLGLCIMKVRSEMTGNNKVTLPGDSPFAFDIRNGFYIAAYQEPVYTFLGTQYEHIFVNGLCEV